MIVKLIPGIFGVIAGTILMRYSFDDKGLKRLGVFFLTVMVNVISQGWLIYVYTELRGGLKVHNCIYWLVGALLFGALVLWASKLMFSFEHEGFRVLTGVCAIVAGWIGGSGIDLMIAFNAGGAIIESRIGAFLLAAAAVLLLISDLVQIVKNFSISRKPIYDNLYAVTDYGAIALLILGTVL